MPSANPLSWGDIHVGDGARFDVTLTPALIDAFAHLTGDFNPLHIKEHVPHGMIAGVLFSRLVGMHLPGERCLYLSQTMQFKKPMPLEVPLVVAGTVTQKSEAAHTLAISTTVSNGDIVLVKGEALVQVR